MEYFPQRSRPLLRSFNSPGCRPAALWTFDLPDTSGFPRDATIADAEYAAGSLGLLRRGSEK